ncbi:DNA polymerase IV [Lactobacillus sp. ESL0679]|uniref:DNA polymerase IV n=1 Tax=Lactobacillus sp. ESL0679 TaxID=2983209 RepID=UPI0023F7C9E9|nr:DNA polymerase IV [Lactobacillus sp. ESL0679]MDF7681906.1 DNA polymerase IV [Lactobacillus sp. ESL0679]
MTSPSDGLLPVNDTHRRIIHVDMDAFYASVEMRDNPTLKNKALVIGQDARKNHGHGVVATANYVARKYGVHSAMPSIKAIRLVPADKLVFLRPDFTKYRAVSAEIHEMMHEITDSVQSIALDEAYLDVTENKLGSTSAVELAIGLQTRIREEEGLNCSFGATYNKFLAKMGSEYAKPFGRTVILPEEARAFLARQKIKKFHGIGPKTQERLHQMGIYTGRGLQRIHVRELIKHFNRMGYLMAEHANGIDLSRVVPDDEHNRKSIGIERTYEPCIYNEQTALTNLRNYAASLEEKLQERNFFANTVVLKIRNNDFVTVTKRRKLPHATHNATEIYQAARELFGPLANSFLNDGIRLLGVTATDFSEADFEDVGLDLFSD